MLEKITSRVFATSLFGLLFLASIMLSTSPVNAQVAGATLSGTVTDMSGGIIPKVQMSIKNVATGVARTITTDAAGFYSVPNLLPGIYEVTATAPGFATKVQTGITLTVGAQQTMNVTMQVGQISQEIRVTGDALDVQLTSSDISAVVNATTVRELPLNGRSWTDLATLQPGVNQTATQAAAGPGPRGNRGFGTEATISGARPQQNNYRLDGVSLNDYANGAPGSTMGGNLGVDAIQEFSVLTSNYSAEYGKTSGGVINAVTRSGSNQFHGTAYEFLRNSALDAPNFFDSTIPPFKRNQFGAAVGGPIRKDRTFFYGDYEGIRQSLGLSFVSFVPSPAARGGNLCSAPSTPTACTPHTVAVDASAQKYLGFYPLPNAGISARGNGDTGVFNFASQQVAREDFFTTRVDHKFSEKDSVFGTYLFDDSPFTAPDALDDLLLGSSTRRQFVALEEDHTFTPSFLNSARLGFNRTRANTSQTLAALNPLGADPSLGVAGRDASQLMINGLPPTAGGLGASSTYLWRWNSFQGYDDASLVHGLHSLKFGVAVERMQLNALTLAEPNGRWYFGKLEDFLTNRPKRFDLMIPGTLTPRGLRQTLFGLYIQDDWRWRPNLTLNLGLRYEMTTVPTEVQGKLSNLINLTDATQHLGDPFFLNPTRHNFEPRLGFAWDPFHSGKTAVRGGFGVFDVLPLPYQPLLLMSQSAPFFKLGTVGTLPPGAFFTGGLPLLTEKGLAQAYLEHAPHRTYVMQWNLNVQHQIAPNLTGMVGYVGSHGVHQPMNVDDRDIVPPTLTSAGYMWPSPQGSGTRLNTNFGSIRGLSYGGSSFYDALELQLIKKMSHGLQVQGSFTWAKSIDTSSSTVAGDAFTNSISSLPYFDLRLSRGLSDFEIGRTLVINLNWQVPQLKSLSGPTAWLTNGWELGAIYRANDGTPFTATYGTNGDPLGINSADPWDVPNRLGGSGCRTLTNPGSTDHYIKTECFAVPTVAGLPPAVAALCDTTVGQPGQCLNLRGNAGRNIVIGPGVSNLDFSVFKNNYVKRISESFNVQFRVEFFNILNRANFGPPVTPDNTDIFNDSGAPIGTAGQLSTTTTTAREIQFALKFVF